MLQATYGSYAFDAGGVEIHQGMEMLRSSRGQHYATRRWVELSGFMKGTDDVDLTLKTSQLLNATSVIGRDFIVYLNGGQPSAIQLLSGGSLTGVRLSRPVEFDRCDGNEYVNTRHFTAAFEVEVPLPGTGSYLLEFEEDIQSDGGGPVYIMRDAIAGAPQKQQTKEQTAYKLIQSGRAVGFLKRPSPPAPLFPFALLKSPAIGKKSPRQRGNSQTEFGITWRYEFGSAAPLNGEPHF